MGDRWDWHLTDRARRDLGRLDEEEQNQILAKLDEVIADEWRNPPDYLKPLEGGPHKKLRVGQFRLGCRADRSQKVLFVHRIKKRGGDAYRGDD